MDAGEVKKMSAAEAAEAAEQMYESSSSEGSDDDIEARYGGDEEGTEDAPYEVSDEVSKITLKSGFGWDKPVELAEVAAVWRVLGDETEGTETSWTVDEDDALPEWLEPAARTMRHCEEALLTVPGPQKIEIKLVKLVLPPGPVDLKKDADKLNRILEVKAMGTKWFKKRDFKRAKRRYEGAVKLTEFMTTGPGDPMSKEALLIRLNLAQVALNLRDWSECRRQCDLVVAAHAEDNDSSYPVVKTLYRRGLALIELGEFKDAKSDFEAALNKATEAESKAIQSALRKLKVASSKQKGKDKKRFENLFEKAKGFATEHRDLPIDSEWSQSVKMDPPKKTQHVADLSRCFLDVSVADPGNKTRRIEIELYHDTVPETVRVFLGLLPKYIGTTFHRIIKDFMIQGGQIDDAPVFDDEAFFDTHAEGVVSMANTGPNTNASQFFILTKPAPHLDHRHVIFGKVVNGMNHVRFVENLDTDSYDRPEQAVTIVSAGLLTPPPPLPPPKIVTSSTPHTTSTTTKTTSSSSSSSPPPDEESEAISLENSSVVTNHQEQ